MPFRQPLLRDTLSGSDLMEQHFWKVLRQCNTDPPPRKTLRQLIMMSAAIVDMLMVALDARCLPARFLAELLLPTCTCGGNVGRSFKGIAHQHEGGSGIHHASPQDLMRGNVAVSTRTFAHSGAHPGNAWKRLQRKRGQAAESPEISQYFNQIPVWSKCAGNLVGELFVLC